jgi:hypothetical protein
MIDEASVGASLLSSVSSLTNTVIGAGMLALPNAFAAMGWLLGSCLIVLCAVVTSFGLLLIKLCEVKLGRRVDTLYALTIAVLPNTVCIIDFIIALKVCVFRVFANQVLRRVHFVSDHQRKFDAAGRQELG